MQYALVEDGRSEAFTGARGRCPVCDAAVLAKCGARVVHHWAHEARRECDPWWENETVWHREWKNHFPEDCREVVHVAADGEIHRADIMSPTGIYIEVQHSAISDEERQAREAFYKNLVWIVDGQPFQDHFDLFHLLPDPSSSLAGDIVWIKAGRGLHGANKGLFWRRTENPDAEPSSGALVRIRAYHEIGQQLEASYFGHQQYGWVRPRRTWLEANCPVYLDFGDEWLFRLERYGSTRMDCVCRVSKRKFLHDVMVETRAGDIATRFYPLS